MWISLSPLLAEVDFVNDHDSVSAIETILSSFCRGEHIIFADRKTLSHLLTVQLSRPNHAALSSIQARYSELKSIEEEQLYRVVVVPNIMQSRRKTNALWFVPLKHFAIVALVPSCVLAENLRDAIAYVGCAIHAQKILGYRGIRVNLTKDSGGGADIPNKLGDLEKAKRQFVMSVTDTDRTHPFGTVCAPTIKCKAIVDKSSWVTEHQAVEGNEIENILPVNLVYDSIEASDAIHTLEKQLDFLKRTTFVTSSLHKWFDLKSGTKLARIRASNVNEIEREYWVEASKHIELKFCCADECADIQECPKADSRDCTCLLLPGLGGATLDRYNTHCATLTIQKQCERVQTSTNADDWLRLGLRVASWGAALEKQRS